MNKTDFKLSNCYFFLLILLVLIMAPGLTQAQIKATDVVKGAVTLVDINSASQQELEGIKGVGPATAKKIIDNRPYKKVDELSKAGLSKKAIAAVKPFVTVGKAEAAPVTAKATKAATAVQTKAAAAEKAISGPVDINSASQKELEGLKGIGAATAKKIIAARPYQSVDELSKAGLSKKAITAVKPFVTVGSAKASSVTDTATKEAAKTTAPVSAAAKDLTRATKDVKSTTKSANAAATKLAPGTKININTADKSTLEKLPEIGPAKAQAIIDGRPYKSIEDVMKVSGIKEKTFAVIKDYITVR